MPPRPRGTPDPAEIATNPEPGGHVPPARAAQDGWTALHCAADADCAANINALAAGDAERLSATDARHPPAAPRRRLVPARAVACSP
jgi:hypothetical protein